MISKKLLSALAISFVVSSCASGPKIKTCAWGGLHFGVFVCYDAEKKKHYEIPLENAPPMFCHEPEEIERTTRTLMLDLLEESKR